MTIAPRLASRRAEDGTFQRSSDLLRLSGPYALAELFGCEKPRDAESADGMRVN